MNAQKRITCHVCGRRFAAQPALLQHQQAMHAVVAQRAAVIAPRKPRAPRARVNNRNVMATAQANTTRSTPNQGTTMSGFERLGSIDLTSSAKTSWQVNAFMVPRLAAVSTAFQRIQFLKLRISTTAYGSAVGTGGYIIGFVADPADQMPSISQLQSQAGARTCKLWENTDFPLSVPNTLYYTSRDNELRWYSPGRIVVLVDGAVTGGSRLVVNLHWTARLTVPTVGDAGTPRTIVLSQNVVVIPGKNILGWKKDNKWHGDCRPILSHILPNGQFIRVPQFGLEYSEGAGDTGTIPVNFLKFDNSEGSLTCSNDGVSVLAAKEVWQSDVQARVVIVSNVPLDLVHNVPVPAADFLSLASNIRNDGTEDLEASTSPLAQLDPLVMTNQLLELYSKLSSLLSQQNSRISSIELMLSRMEKAHTPLPKGGSVSPASRSLSQDSIKQPASKNHDKTTER